MGTNQGPTCKGITNRVLDYIVASNTIEALITPLFFLDKSPCKPHFSLRFHVKIRPSKIKVGEQVFPIQPPALVFADLGEEVADRLASSIQNSDHSRKRLYQRELGEFLEAIKLYIYRYIYSLFI